MNGPTFDGRASRNGQQGLSLMEVMVGIVIGLVGVVVMFQTMTAWDSRNRTSVSGNDAQVAGSLALYQLERDLRLAGLGFATADTRIMGCQVRANRTASGDFSFNLFPVQIIDGGADGEPDTIRVLYGNSAFFTGSEAFVSSDATSKKAGRRAGLQQGDLIVVAGNDSGAAGSADCALKQITDNTNPDGYTISHSTGVYANFYTGKSDESSRFNEDPATPPTFSSGTLFSLGPQPRLHEWQVSADGRVLSHTDLIFNAGPFEVAEGVVNLQGQYGVDADGDGRIADGEWTTVAPGDWTQVLAVRVALLVRSQQFEKRPAGAADSLWTAPQPAWAGGTFKMTNVDGSDDSDTAGSPNNWRYYRYRTYEKVIPLRNMIWGTSP